MAIETVRPGGPNALGGEALKAMPQEDGERRRRGASTSNRLVSVLSALNLLAGWPIRRVQR
jgi:hypothetical protein